MNDVVAIRKTEEPPDAVTKAAIDAQDSRRQAFDRLHQLGGRSDTSKLATAVLNKTLIDMLNGPPIDPRHASKIIEATNTIVRLEAGEATSITAPEAQALVKQFREKAEAAIAAAQTG